MTLTVRTAEDIAAAALEDRKRTCLAAVEAHIEARARAVHDASAAQLAGYVASRVPEWQAEAFIFVSWRDAVWLMAFSLLAAADPADPDGWPTVETVLAALPAWPAPDPEAGAIATVTAWPTWPWSDPQEEPGDADPRTTPGRADLRHALDLVAEALLARHRRPPAPGAPMRPHRQRPSGRPAPRRTLRGRPGCPPQEPCAACNPSPSPAHSRRKPRRTARRTAEKAFSNRT